MRFHPTVGGISDGWWVVSQIIPPPGGWYRLGTTPQPLGSTPQGMDLVMVSGWFLMVSGRFLMFNGWILMVSGWFPSG